MPVPILSDGTPLTFEWLNAVANAINTLELNDENNSNISVKQQGSNDEDISFVTGKKEITVGAPGRKRGIVSRNNIKFPTAFRDDDVTVVAMVTSTKNNEKPIAAGVAVGGVTATNFDIVVQLFDDDEKFTKDSFEVRYIAIGKRAII